MGLKPKKVGNHWNISKLSWKLNVFQWNKAQDYFDTDDTLLYLVFPEKSVSSIDGPLWYVRIDCSLHSSISFLIRIQFPGTNLTCQCVRKMIEMESNSHYHSSQRFQFDIDGDRGICELKMVRHTVKLRHRLWYCFSGFFDHVGLRCGTKSFD